MPESGPDPYVQFLENWIPGIGECTELHDKLHEHFELDFSVNSEARLLGFQLGHHPAANFLHVVIFFSDQHRDVPALVSQWLERSPRLFSLLCLR